MIVDGDAERLLVLASEIDDPVLHHRAVAGWCARASAELRAHPELADWSEQFEDLRDYLRLPAPSLAESWDVEEYDARFREAAAVLQGAARFLSLVGEAREVIVTEDSVGSEIAGGLARFWRGGDGPSHSSIGTAFALAGYEEPDSGGNKEERVRFAVQDADGPTARRVVEELLVLLRSAGLFDLAGDDPAVSSLIHAFERRGHGISSDGFVDWHGVESTTLPPVTLSRQIAQSPETVPAEVVEVIRPTVGLLLDSLRRLASALRPLVKRRRGRVGLQIADEYDLQDIVEALLRSLYNDVRAEERTPSYAGSSSVMDFLLRDSAVAVEVKVTARGRSTRQIKTELLVDIHDYQQHPSVETLIAVVYDLASTFDNPQDSRPTSRAATTTST